MRSLALLLLALVSLLAGPTAAALASGADVLRDCTDDERMSKTYTQKEYRDALDELSADTDQYGNCREVVRRAQLAAARAGKGKTDTNKGGGNEKDNDKAGGAGAIGSPPADEQLDAATPAEQQAVAQARRDSASVKLADTTVNAAKEGVAPNVSQAAALPAPVVVLLALLLAGALALGTVRIRSLVNARRG